MSNSGLTSRLFAAAFLLALGAWAMAQEAGSENPKDTEVWTPVPPVVTPGAIVGAAPSDAIVLFDGKSLSEWVSAQDRSRRSPPIPLRPGRTASPSVLQALPRLRQHHSYQLLAVLPRGQIDALQKLREWHAFPALLCLVDHSQENDLAAH